MASDADKLRAERIYIESDKLPSDRAIAATCGMDRATLKRARIAGDWEVRRAEYWRRATNAATSAATANQAAVEVLTRLTALGILADCARSGTAQWRDRITAIKLAAEVEQWLGESRMPGADKSSQQTQPSGVLELPMLDPPPIHPDDQEQVDGASDDDE